MSSVSVVSARRPLRLVKPALEVATSVIFAGLMTYFGVLLSVEYGHLSMPAGYDDVSYLLDGQRWLSQFASGGVWSSFVGLLDQHAPLQTLTAAIGFAVFGPYDWGPYCVNGVYLALTLWAGFRLVEHENAPAPASFLLVLCLGLIPFFQTTITEFRPDLFTGILVGFSVVGLFGAPIFRASRAKQFAAGLLFGLALLAKPSEFLASGFVIAVAVLLSTLAFCLDLKFSLRREVENIAKAYLYVLLGSVLVFGPYLAVAGGTILDYIRASLVVNESFWAYTGNGAQRGALLSRQPGCRHGALYLVAHRARDFPRQERSHMAEARADGHALASYLMLVVIYLVISSTSVKSFFLGSMFYASFALLMVRDWAWMVAGLPRKFYVYGISPAYAALILFLGLDAILVPTPFLETAYYPSGTADVTRATLTAWAIIVHESEKDGGRDRKRPLSILVNGPDPVRSAAIELQGLRVGLRLDVTYDFTIASVSEFMVQAKKSDLIFVTGSVENSLPGPQLGDPFAEALQEAGFVRLQSIDLTILSSRSGFPNRPHLQRSERASAIP